MGDSFAPEFHEVTDGQHGAALVVRNEATRFGVFDLRKDVDHRNFARARQLRAFVGAASRDDDAISPLADKLLDVMRLPRRIVRGVAHKHRHAAVR
jgi:hypothetical protein